MRIKKESEDYKCEFCEKPFPQSQKMKNHIKRIHDEEKKKM